MSDVFISYARENKAFVEQLVEALDNRELTVWVDWEDIPWTADWWQEIQRGIDSHNNFVFVVSAYSLQSVVCMMEVHHAVQANKRLVPIVLEEPDHAASLEALREIEVDLSAQQLLEDADPVTLSKENWQAIARHNWLFMTDDNAFDESVENLMEAIRSDLDFMRQHTRLLVRATEWDNQERDAGYLLTGSELQEAESWLASSGSKEPKPTQLHTEYIHAGRRHANSRQRRLLAGVTTALVITVILGVLSAGLWQLAERQRARADEQAQVSESGRIAVESLLAMSNAAYDRALLLSLEAIAIDDNPQARSSLLTGLQRLPQLTRFLHTHETWVRTIAYHPDGTQFATADADGNIYLWDAATLDVNGAPLPSAESGVWSLAYHPDGDLLAAATADGTVELWDVTNREMPIAFLPVSASEAFSVAFHPDGEVLASSHADGTIYLWDIAAEEQIAALDDHGDWVSIVTFSDDGTRMASGARDASVYVWDTGDLDDITLEHELGGHNNWVFALDFDPSGTVLASGGADATVRLWDATSGEALGSPLTDHRGWVRQVQFNAEGTLLASASEDRTLILRDAQNGRRLRGVPPLRGHSDEIFGLAFHPEDDTLISGDQTGAVLVWDAQARQPLAQTLAQNDGAIYSLDVTADGMLLSAADSGTVQRTALASNADSDTVSDSIQAEEQLTTATLAPDGSQVALALADGRIVTYPADLSASSDLAGHDAFVLALAFNSDGMSLASGGEDNLVKVWDVTTGEQRGAAIEGFDAPISALAFQPNSSTLAIGTEAGGVSLWNADTGAEIRALPTRHSDNITALAFNPAGTLLASGSRDNSIILWDVAAGSEVGTPLTAHENWVLDLNFSPDGTRLASGSRDETIVLWDVASRQPIGQPFAAQHGWVWQIAFTPDGESLLSGSDDGTLERWTITLRDWQDRACAISNRQLTDRERQVYLSALATGTVCNDFRQDSNS